MKLSLHRELEIPDVVLKHIKYLMVNRLDSLVIRLGGACFYISHWNEEYCLEVTIHGDEKIMYTFKDQNIFERILEDESIC